LPGTRHHHGGAPSALPALDRHSLLIYDRTRASFRINRNVRKESFDEDYRRDRRVDRHWLGLRQCPDRGRLTVFGSVRKQADADRLSTEFGLNFTPLLFDVTDEAAVAAGAKQVEAALGGETLSGLVNNAGIAVPGPLLHLKIDDFEHQLTVNVTGQLIVTQAFAPLLGVDRSRKGAPGRIVMISSVGGKNAMPFLGAYSASKFALEGMSESLRRELMPFGIDVIIVAPGTVATPIWDKADTLDLTPFADSPYAPALGKLKAFMVANDRKGLPVEKLGETVKAALTLSNPKTRYTVAPNPVQNLMANTLPKRIIDRIIARQLGLK
jgi:NAD(P)-dependent dehydrogenase (short-subunit alcohol dehydrogenase family)